MRDLQDTRHNATIHEKKRRFEEQWGSGAKLNATKSPKKKRIISIAWANHDFEYHLARIAPSTRIDDPECFPSLF